MKKIVVATPYVSERAKREVMKTLNTRWIGQGPKVDLFEREFEKKFKVKNAIAVNSGTSALELAYDLIGIGPGDEVITPVLTCTATNLPIVRRGAKIVFSDVKDNLTADPDNIWSKITAKTKAIVIVDLNGIKGTRETFRFKKGMKPIPVIVDAAQALGNFGGDFTICSFQAIKHLTTGDGGMLICKNKKDADKARLLRWFGIDRALKLKNNWQPYKQRKILFDINYAGYKFQMNDIAAAMGLGGLKEYDKIISHRKKIFEIYKEKLPMIDGPDNKYGFACVLVGDRDAFAEKMTQRGIETNVMQVRNDIYSIFAPYRSNVPNMDFVDEHYLCLPMHNQMTLKEAQYIADEAYKAL
jgi:perosamine synthetase